MLMTERIDKICDGITEVGWEDEDEGYPSEDLIIIKKLLMKHSEGKTIMSQEEMEKHVKEAIDDFYARRPWRY